MVGLAVLVFVALGVLNVGVDNHTNHGEAEACAVQHAEVIVEDHHCEEDLQVGSCECVSAQRIKVR